MASKGNYNWPFSFHQKLVIQPKNQKKNEKINGKKTPYCNIERNSNVF